MAFRQCFLRTPELTKIVLPKVLQNFQKTPKCTCWPKEQPKRFPAQHTIPDETKGSIFSALCDFFPHERPPSIFWSFATEWMLKNPKGSSLSVFFGIVRLFKKNFHKSSPNSPILGNFEVLLLFLSLGYGADLGRSRLVNGSS